MLLLESGKEIIISGVFSFFPLDKEYSLKKNVESSKNEKAAWVNCGVCCRGWAGERGLQSSFPFPVGVAGALGLGDRWSEWLCWGGEAKQGVLIIGFRTSVWEFNRCPGHLGLSVSCPDSQSHCSNLTPYGKTVTERGENILLHF